MISYLSVNGKIDHWRRQGCRDMMATMIDFERIDHEAENDEKERENGMSSTRPTHHNYLE